MDSEGSVRDEYNIFLRSRWLVDVDSNVSFILPEPISFVTNLENRKLIRIVFIEEIRSTLWSMVEDKASGPDGFPPFFFKRYWLII